MRSTLESTADNLFFSGEMEVTVFQMSGGRDGAPGQLCEGCLNQLAVAENATNEGCPYGGNQGKTIPEQPVLGRGAVQALGPKHNNP